MATFDELARAGMAAISEKKFDVAISSFTAALQVEPNRPDITNALGMAHMHRGDIGGAIPYLEQAVALAEPFVDPRYQEMKLSFHLGLASAYEVHDRTGDALRTLEAAVAKWPDQITPRLQLAQLLLASCRLEDGLAAYKALATHPGLDREGQAAAQTVVDAVRAFQESENPPSVFLQGHCESYKTYFDEVTAESVQSGWYAEAARMARGADGEIRPFMAEGSRPYAMQRIDVVNPADGTAASVYSEAEPMVVALNGLEPLAQLPIALPWKEQNYPIFVSTRCPWHWLNITVQFEEADPKEERVVWLDDTIGSWYLEGYNGTYGEKDWGRFHFITDPELLGDRAVTYTVDLGRSKYEAILGLLSRLAVLHEKHAIRRLVLGQARIPD